MVGGIITSPWQGPMQNNHYSEFGVYDVPHKEVIKNVVAYSILE